MPRNCTYLSSSSHFFSSSAPTFFSLLIAALPSSVLIFTLLSFFSLMRMFSVLLRCLLPLSSFVESFKFSIIMSTDKEQCYFHFFVGHQRFTAATIFLFFLLDAIMALNISHTFSRPVQKVHHPAFKMLLLFYFTIYLLISY